MRQEILTKPPVELNAEQEHLYKHHPFEAVDGTDLISNLRGAERFYRHFRQSLMDPDSSDVAVFLIQAKTNSGKRTALSQIARVLKNDLYLHRSLQQQNIAFDLSYVSFASTLTLMKDEGAVNSNIQNGQMDEETAHKISTRMTGVLATELGDIPTKPQQRAKKVILVEPSGPTVDLPGHGLLTRDVGYSTIRFLSGDSKMGNPGMKRSVWTMAMIASQEVSDSSLALRKGIYEMESEGFVSAVKNAFLKPLFQQAQGIEHMSSESIQLLQKSLRENMNSPEGVIKSHQGFERQKEILQAEGYIMQPTDEAYWSFVLNQHFGFLPGQTIITHNGWVEGGVTLDEDTLEEIEAVGPLRRSLQQMMMIFLEQQQAVWDGRVRAADQIVLSNQRERIEKERKTTYWFGNSLELIHSLKAGAGKLLGRT